MVGFPAGGPVDIIARLIGQWLSDRLGQQFVIENRPGAGSNIATEAVVRARADGYTLLLAISSNAINATLYEKLNFNFIRDIAPVGSIARTPYVMEVNPPSFVDRAHQGWQAAPAGGDHRNALRGFAGGADCGRVRAGV
jgi:tripartite-type tricarboxylate transporter receptor subunit TctC